MKFYILFIAAPRKTLALINREGCPKKLAKVQKPDIETRIFLFLKLYRYSEFSTIFLPFPFLFDREPFSPAKRILQGFVPPARPHRPGL